MNVFRRLRQLLNKKQKRTVGLLIVLIFISALLETLGVSVIVPLVSAVVSPETFLENENVTLVFSHLGIEQPDADAFIRILLVITMVVFAVKNAYLLFLYYVQARFVTKTEASTSVRLFQEYLNRHDEFYHEECFFLIRCRAFPFRLPIPI